ncbi:MAG: hypothetical protein JSR89_08095 [Proteobacteria bacterium]|nr:hypothetical protein [Pseudomonadota bacterium]
MRTSRTFSRASSGASLVRIFVIPIIAVAYEHPGEIAQIWRAGRSGNPAAAALEAAHAFIFLKDRGDGRVGPLPSKLCQAGLAKSR